MQTDDILGGLAARGYGATGFSGGQGQMMFRAAEPWTDAAHGTYLQLTTTPLGSGSWVERLRINPAGNVGIGTTAPGQKLSMAGTIERTTGGIKFPDGSVQTMAATGDANNSAFGYLTLANNTAVGSSSLTANTTGYSKQSCEVDPVVKTGSGVEIVKVCALLRGAVASSEAAAPPRHLYATFASVYTAAGV